MGVLIGTIVNVLLVGVGGAVLRRSVVDSPMMPLLLNEREQKKAKQYYAKPLAIWCPSDH